MDDSSFAIDPQAAEIAERRKLCRELGNAAADARQWLHRTADGAARCSALAPVTDRCYRTAEDLQAALRDDLAVKLATASGDANGDETGDVVGVRYFIFSRRLKRDLIVTVFAEGDRMDAHLMHGGGGLTAVPSLDSPDLQAVWLDSMRRYAGLKLAKETESDGADALELLREAFAADSADIAAGMEFGEFLMANGDVMGAMGVWRKLHDDNPYFAEPLVRMAEAMVMVGLSQQDQQALKLADALSGIAAQRFTDEPAAQVVRAQFLRVVKRPAEAAEILSAVVAANPNFVMAAFQLGMIAAEANRWQDAEQQFRSCVERATSADAWRIEFLRWHGKALGELGDLAAAHRQLDAAEAIAPNDPRTAEFRADIPPAKS